MSFPPERRGSSAAAAAAARLAALRAALRARLVSFSSCDRLLLICAVTSRTTRSAVDRAICSMVWASSRALPVAEVVAFFADVLADDFLAADFLAVALAGDFFVAFLAVDFLAGDFLAG